MNNWINVNDRLPTESGTYLCYTLETKSLTETTIIQSYSPIHGFSDIFGDVYETNITHWQPLPEAPNKEKQKSNSVLSVIMQESDSERLLLSKFAKWWEPLKSEEYIGMSINKFLDSNGA